MSPSRRLSQAISEGDGISLLVPVDDAGTASTAEQRGAEGIVVTRGLPGLEDATTLPVFWHVDGAARAALEAGADACLVRVDAAGNGSRLMRRHAEAQGLGLESVVGVRDDDELELALEHVDPEIFLLSPAEDDDADPLEQVLDLLPDVPAGKLAIAEVPVQTRDEVVALERAGVDAVIVGADDVERLVGGAPPEV